jgi:glutamate-1-semialdehyde 2,1-aminomutase
MLQYYLRAAGVALSWVGTGRLIFSLNYTDEDFTAVADRIIAAAEEMRRDGWWWSDSRLTNKAIKRRVLKEMFQARWASGPTGRPAASPIGSINSPRIK